MPETRVDYVRKILHIPDYIIPFALVPIGYPVTEAQEVPHRYDPSRIHYNQW